MKMDKETLVKRVYNNTKSVLQTDFNNIELFFTEIQKGAADYIIFISRRCYILYQIYALIMGWDKENVISDRGLWCYRSKLNMAKSVVIADDMILHGGAMKKVLVRIRHYVPEACKIESYVYCIYNNAMPVAREHSIKSFTVKTSRDCKKLTEKLVRCILVNGIPYTTFAFSWYGKACAERDIPKCSKEDKLVQFDNDVCEHSDKWETAFQFALSEAVHKLVDVLSDGACLRIYKREDLQTVIPFTFMSRVRAEYVPDYYHIIKDCFVEAGIDIIAKEFGDALDCGEDVKESVTRDKWVYLAALLECCITRMIGLLEQVGDMFDVTFYEEITKPNMQGTFSTDVVEAINRIDIDSSLKFIERIVANENCFKKYVCKATDEIFVNIDTKYTSLVEEYGTKQQDERQSESMSDSCREIIINIFEDMRIEYDLYNQELRRYIKCNEIIYMLKKYFKMSEILAAQIDTWDQGMAAYEFEYDEVDGIYAKCGIGERSALIFAMKYGNIICKYYAWLTLAFGYEGSLTQNDKWKYLEQLVNENNALTNYDKAFFFDTIRNNLECLYDYYISY